MRASRRTENRKEAIVSLRKLISPKILDFGQTLSALLDHPLEPADPNKPSDIRRGRIGQMEREILTPVRDSMGKDTFLKRVLIDSARSSPS